VVIGSDDEIQQDLPDSADLAQASDRAPMFRVVEREVDQLQRTCQGPLRQLRVTVSPFQRSTDFAPDVSQLFGEAQRPSSPVGELSMGDFRHRRTNGITIAAIFSRVA